LRFSNADKAIRPEALQRFPRRRREFAGSYDDCVELRTELLDRLTFVVFARSVA